MSTKFKKCIADIRTIAKWFLTTAICVPVIYGGVTGLSYLTGSWNENIRSLNLTIMERQMNENGFQLGATVEFVNAEAVTVCKGQDWRSLRNGRYGPHHIFCKIAEVE